MIIETMAQKIPNISRLSASIIRVLGCNPGPMTLQGTNTYLLGTGKKRILIDTGDEAVPEYVKNLKSVLDEEKATISTVILTHWHHDHVGGVKDVLKLSRPVCDIWKFPRTDAVDICPEIPEDVKVHKLTNGQEFSVEGASVKIVHTPGHTTDHVILTNQEGAVFSGDCILGEGTAVFEDLYDYMKSLDHILKIKPSIIYPGHGNIIEDPIDRIEYYINHRNQREAQIIKFFQDGAPNDYTTMDVVKTVYKETPEKLWPAAAYNVGHHVQKLKKDNILEIVGAEDVDDTEIRWRIKSK
ncbi:beta-lactamase-like protein 2 homolog [Eupeodes corollae]|uniref:beta-lactamase-like protein 2 homolog n=1 Tax=Eupeodes corollae TaxID=290404 RepID=UPI0024909407|nr:beta-lactamase-like protein 2 homolog [Eupeodes corollae]